MVAKGEDMKKKHSRRGLWPLLTVVIAVLTVRTVFSAGDGISLREILRGWIQASPFWLTVAFLCMAGFIVMEGFAIERLLRSLGYARGMFRATYYSAADQFFSAITPSATGGQPATALLMDRHEIPAGVYTATLLLNLVMYTAATALIGIVCLVWRFDIFLSFSLLSKILILFGIVVLAGLSLLFWILLKHGTFIYRGGGRLFHFLHRIRLMRKPDRWEERLERITEDYEQCARLMANKPGTLLIVFGFNLLQRMAQISVTLATHLAMGGRLDHTGGDVWFVQAFSQIGSNCVPIPGGMGAADYLMLDGFQRLFPHEYVYQLQMLSRGISFYLCTLLSGLLVLIGAVIGRVCLQRKANR